MLPEDLLTQMIFGNPVWRWLLVVAIAALIIMVVYTLRQLLANRLKKISERTTTQLDDLVVKVVNRTNPFLIAVFALYGGSLIVTLPENTREVLSHIALVALILQGGLWASVLMTFAIRMAVRYEEGNENDRSAVDTLTFIGRLVLWSLVVLFALNNIPGVEVTSLVAGLGITGVAVALAVQNILGDLFASLSIMLDKPFRIGDFIVVGDFAGTVEDIGLKTTRIRSLGGEELIFSNTDLLSSRIRNYKRMQERRIVFDLNIKYETPPEKAKLVPEIAREVVEGTDGTRFDRAHLLDFSEFALAYEVVYYVLSADYNVYMDIQQAINFGLMERFVEEEIKFAYPAQRFVMESGQEVNEAMMSEETVYGNGSN